MISAPANRRIRRLAIRAPSREGAQRMAFLLEDALRTASFPEGESGRLFVIRKLELGRVPPGISSISLSLLIERAFRNARAHAVPTLSPRASTASAIVFNDAIEALAVAANRLCGGRGFSEWYWQSVFNTWSSPQRSPQWVDLIEISHRMEMPAVAAAAVVREAILASALPRLVSNLNESRAREWLRGAGFSLNAPPESHSFSEPQAKPAVKFADLQFETQLADALRTLNPSPKIAQWLVVLAAVADRPACANDHALPQRALIWFQNKVVNNAPRAQRVELPSKSTDDCAGPQRRNPAVENTAPNVVRSIESKTVLGGIFFLVPIIERLGIREFLKVNRDLISDGFPFALLKCFASARVRELDPVLQFLHGQSLENDSSVAAELPEALRRTIETPPPRCGMDGPFAPWIAAARRWSRRRARVGLYTLVHRPAQVSISRTHIDVTFRLDQSDLRVRRAGLDINPGWVPWLGRAIQFHYVHETDA
jgi:hypothetical protein